MGGVLSMAFCCACTGLSCACSMMGCCFSVASSAAGGITSRVANYMNIILLGAFTVLCLILRFYADDWDWEFAGYSVGCSNVNETKNLDVTGQFGEYYAYCEGDAAVYRVSSALASFYFLNIFFAACGTGFHRGFWFWKILLVCGAAIGFMFIPPESFNEEAYIWTARSFSFVFILVQLLLVLGFAYSWNEKWVDNAYTEGANEKCWLSGVLISAVLLYVASFAGIVLLYIHYQCSLANWVTTLTMIAIIVFTLLTLFRDRYTEYEGAILPSGVVSSYIVYIAWSALEANPDVTCKAYDVNSMDNGNGGTITVGVFIAAVSIMWLATQSTGSARSFLNGKDKTSKAPNTLVYEVGEGQSAESMRSEQEGRRQSDDGGEGVSDQLAVAVFYFVLITTTFYMSMTVTNWGTTDVLLTGQTEASMWIRIASQWLAILLYIWTIVAPAILTNRDFSRPELPHHPKTPAPTTSSRRAPRNQAAQSQASSAAGSSSSKPNNTSIAYV